MTRIAALVAVFSFALAGSFARAADAPPPPKPDFPVILATQNQDNAFLTGEDGKLSVPVMVTATVANSTSAAETAHVTFSVTDYWGKPVGMALTQDLTVDGGKSGTLTLIVTPPMRGAYTVTAHSTGGAVAGDASLTFIVLWPPYPGLRPESFFASNTYMSGGVTLHQKIGLRIYRQHFADSTHSITPETGKADRKTTDPFKFDFTEQDKYVADCAAHDISIVGIVGYANQQWGVTDATRVAKMYGPPRDVDEYIRATVPVVAHFKSIKYWEFWNEPWIYGWTWAGSPALYREFQGNWIRAAKKARPDIKVIAANSASFLQDNIEPDPFAWKGILDADTNHPYRDGGEPTQRMGGQQRYIDFGVQEGNRMGLPMHFITENGTDIGWSTPGDHDDPLNAPKLVVMHVLAALDGEYEQDIQQEIGWGPNQMRGSAAYGVMTHFLEDRVPVSDIWPSHPLIWGCVFANPKFADRHVARAKYLSARWNTPGRTGDNTKVAVVWSYTGLDQANLDQNGTLTIAAPGDIKAYDIMGNEAGSRPGGSLMVPFGQYPVYLTSDSMSIKQLNDAIAQGAIGNVTPFNLSIYSITKPLDQKPSIVVRVQNQLNEQVTGSVSLTLPNGWTVSNNGQGITMKPAEMVDVSFPLTAAVANDTNLYPITASVDLTPAPNLESRRTPADWAGVKLTSSRTQVVQVAVAARKTITVDGKLDDWAGVIPVTMDSDTFAAGVDWTKYVLNPSLPRPDAVASKPRVVTKAYTAYDANNFYAAFAIHEPALKNSAGTPTAYPPYLNGMLDGINFPVYTGDSVQFVFGFNPRANDDYRQADDPWYWKGDFRDTDYDYIIYTSTQGPQLIRLHKPGVAWRDGYQCEAPAGEGPIPGAKAVITRDGDTSIYELSIPRSEIAMFKPEKQDSMRWGFSVSTDEGVGPGGPLQWSQAAGVYDYWLNNGSYQPTWQSMYAAQTAWGMGR